MSSNPSIPRPDFNDSFARASETVRAMPGGPRLDTLDADELLANADAPDLHLLRLVGCVALATVLLALATGLTA